MENWYGKLNVLIVSGNKQKRGADGLRPPRRVFLYSITERALLKTRI